MITYQPESVIDIQPQLLSLVEDHYEELADTSVPLDVDWSKYYQMETIGIYYTLTVRDNGVLIGYIGYIVTPHIRYQSEVFAVADVFYLKPEYRKGRIGIKLFQYAEQEMKRHGVTKIVNHVKLKNDFGKIFEYLGYKPLERSYIKGI